VLANINKNVILENLAILAKQMSTGGVLLVSGILEDDIDEILTESRKLTLQLIYKIEKDNWLCLRLSSA
jgi:ribosomal protein L11 methyltransferase